MRKYRDILEEIVHDIALDADSDEDQNETFRRVTSDIFEAIQQVREDYEFTP